MFLFWVKISFAFELKGCQLSEICITGFPYALYISSKAGITFVDFGEVSSFAVGNLDPRSWTTST